MHRRTMVAAVAAGALALPASAGAHVSFHPNVVPVGAFATIALRVPNEQDKANTTSVAIQMPPGFLDVSADPPPGWSFSVKTVRLATPVKTDDGTVTTQVSEVDFTGGRIAPGQFALFPMSVVMPGRAGSLLAFKTVQHYDNGQVARWIDTSPGAASPAPTIAVSAKGGPLLDVAGTESGPPASAATATGATTTAAPAGAAAPASAPAATSKGASKGLAIAALIVGILGLLAGGAALATRRGAPA